MVEIFVDGSCTNEDLLTCTLGDDFPLEFHLSSAKWRDTEACLRTSDGNANKTQPNPFVLVSHNEQVIWSDTGHLNQRGDDPSTGPEDL